MATVVALVGTIMIGWTDFPGVANFTHLRSGIVIGGHHYLNGSIVDWPTGASHPTIEVSSKDSG